jgi:2,3-bisphosphoglycerate-dependent phosphoglycerate mutase
MRLIIARHGQSTGNIDETEYARVGDSNVELTNLGWQQALRAGQFLQSFYQNNSNNDNESPLWPRVWTSSFLRTRQTTKGILEGIGLNSLGGKCKLHEDPRLVEQSFGLLGLLVRGHEDDHKHKTYQAISDLSKEFHLQQKFTARTPFGESPQDAYTRVDLFMQTLKRDKEAGTTDHLIISHGATIKAFLMRWFHLPMTAWEQLKTPHNCDVFCIEQTNAEERLDTGHRWKVRKIFDGETGEACDINPIAHIERLTVDSLPKMPDHLKENPLPIVGLQATPL